MAKPAAGIWPAVTVPLTVIVFVPVSIASMMRLLYPESVLGMNMAPRPASDLAARALMPSDAGEVSHTELGLAANMKADRQPQRLGYLPDRIPVGIRELGLLEVLRLARK